MTYLFAGLYARQETKKLYEDGYRTDDESDAFRHAYLNAYLAKAEGKTIAKLYADAHEYGYPGNFSEQSFLSTKMDLYNNSVGRNIGANHTYVDTLPQSIRSYLRVGAFVKIENNELVRTNLDMEFKSN